MTRQPAKSANPRPSACELQDHPGARIALCMLDLQPIGRAGFAWYCRAQGDGACNTEDGDEPGGPNRTSRRTESPRASFSHPFSRRLEDAGGEIAAFDAPARQGVRRDRHGARLLLRRPERADAAL